MIQERLEACCKVAVYLLLSGKLLTFSPEVSPDYPKLFVPFSEARGFKTKLPVF